jgi:D-alanyl-D-alanine carboxypeptidase
MAKARAFVHKEGNIVIVDTDSKFLLNRAVTGNVTRTSIGFMSAADANRMVTALEKSEDVTEVTFEGEDELSLKSFSEQADALVSKVQEQAKAQGSAQPEQQPEQQEQPPEPPAMIGVPDEPQVQPPQEQKGTQPHEETQPNQSTMSETQKEQPAGEQFGDGTVPSNVDRKTPSDVETKNTSGTAGEGFAPGGDNVLQSTPTGDQQIVSENAEVAEENKPADMAPAATGMDEPEPGSIANPLPDPTLNQDNPKQV